MIGGHRKDWNRVRQGREAKCKLAFSQIRLNAESRETDAGREALGEFAHLTPVFSFRDLIPKNNGPDQRVPAIVLAILERLPYFLPSYS